MAKLLRYEYKYLVPLHRIDDLREWIRPHVRTDCLAGNGTLPRYTVRSIYFDTPLLSDYTEKVEGYSKRKKIRLRGYNRPEGEGAMFFEIKRKRQAGIHKSRVKVGLADARALAPGQNGVCLNGGAPRGDGIATFQYYIHRERLEPRLLVVYEREAYFDRFNNAIRLTFDQNLRSRPCERVDHLFSEEGLVPALPDHFIFEVKFYRGIPLWVKECVTHFRLKHQALSKYVLGWDSQTAAAR